MLLFFFFKQKTAYDMRISDWSSDVCSSDLAGDNRCNWQIRHAAWQRSHPDRRLPASGNDRRGSSGPEAEPFPPTAATPRSPRRRQDRSVPGRHPKPLAPSDRKSVVSGKSVSVRVDPGGVRIIRTQSTSLQYEANDYKAQTQKKYD